jgi:hypothetical protein
LINEKKEKKKVAMKRIVANMTLGNDMSDLFQDVLQCMSVPDSEIKKMVYLYVINYARLKPDLAVSAVSSFVRVSLEPKHRSVSMIKEGTAVSAGCSVSIHQEGSSTMVLRKN